MNTVHIDTPITKNCEYGKDELQRWVCIGENKTEKLLIVFWLNAENEDKCITMMNAIFMERSISGLGNYTIVPVSSKVEYINLSSNDEDVIRYLNLD